MRSDELAGHIVRLAGNPSELVRSEFEELVSAFTMLENPTIKLLPPLSDLSQPALASIVVQIASVEGGTALLAKLADQLSHTNTRHGPLDIFRSGPREVVATILNYLPSAKHAADIYLRLASSDDEVYAAVASMRLAELGKAGEEKLKANLAHKDGEVRAESLLGLAKLGDSKLDDHVALLANDNHRAVRLARVAVSRKLEADSALQIIKSALESSDPELRWAAEEAAIDLGVEFRN